MRYLEDPKNNKPSVSLTTFAISFIVVLGFGIAFVIGRVEKEPGPLMELFYASAALYFGRRAGNIFSKKDKDKESE